MTDSDWNSSSEKSRMMANTREKDVLLGGKSATVTALHWIYRASNRRAGMDTLKFKSSVCRSDALNSGVNDADSEREKEVERERKRGREIDSIETMCGERRRVRSCGVGQEGDDGREKEERQEN